MKTTDFARLGVPQGEPMKRAHEFLLSFRAGGGDMTQLESEVAVIVANPAAFLSDPLREAFARTLYEPPFKQREHLAPWRQWGTGLEAEAGKFPAPAADRGGSARRSNRP